MKKNHSGKPVKISRSKIDLFFQCKRCFWLDLVKDIKRPPSPPFTLNSAVDQLMKNEMDEYRKKKMPHPLALKNSLNLIPFDHEKIDDWRQNSKGIGHLHGPTGLYIHGSPDEVWVDGNEILFVVDFKATSKKDTPSLEDGWGPNFKRQVEVYQWLFKQNSFKVSDKAYFLYSNGIKGNRTFENMLLFESILLVHEGDTSWVEGVLLEISECLKSKNIPEANPKCQICNYFESVSKL